MLSYTETKILINNFLDAHAERARAALYVALKRMGSSEGEFYESIAKHAPTMKLTSEQWYDLLSRLPNRVLWSQIQIAQFLSEEQIKRLPLIKG